MNNTFSFQRFWRFFLYDMKRWATSYGPSFLIMCLMPLVLFAITMTISLVFTQEVAHPALVARAMVLAITASLLFITYPSHVYGFLTDKNSGSSYLMIPASKLEKFASMMLNVLVVVPAVFFAIYLGTDALLCLIDPNCGNTLLRSAGEAVTFLSTLGGSMEGPEQFISINFFYVYLCFGISILYYLLGAVLFKKHKILYPILILFGLNMLLSLVLGGLISLGLFDGFDFEKWILSIVNDGNVGAMVTWFNALSAFVNVAAIAGLGTAIYFRIKTLKH
ncbi:MAG: hypothetical protein ACI4UJ_01205 [Candidatus Cryptobacteroides sp.]